jgi:uncharacterized membrane protein YbhN (UPF0104 family)
MTRRSTHVAGVAAAGAALAAVTAAGVGERTAVAASFTVLAHPQWQWIPAALLLETVSMAAFAVMLRRLLAAGGAPVPWHDLLLVYGTGVAAQSLNITPGGLGITEGSLSLALVATGLGASQALAAVLLYRLASFWLVALAGWLVVFWLRRPAARRARAPSPNRAVPGPGAAAGLAPGTPSFPSKPPAGWYAPCLTLASN